MSAVQIGRDLWNLRNVARGEDCHVPRDEMLWQQQTAVPWRCRCRLRGEVVAGAGSGYSRKLSRGRFEEEAGSSCSSCCCCCCDDEGEVAFSESRF